MFVPFKAITIDKIKKKMEYTFLNITNKLLLKINQYFHRLDMLVNDDLSTKMKLIYKKLSLK